MAYFYAYISPLPTARRKRSSSWASAWHLAPPAGLTASDGSWCSVPWCTGGEPPGTPRKNPMAEKQWPGSDHPKISKWYLKWYPKFQILLGLWMAICQCRCGATKVSCMKDRRLRPGVDVHLECFHVGVSWVTGDPQVTMGFNIKMVQFWMISGYPAF